MTAVGGTITQMVPLKQFQCPHPNCSKAFLSDGLLQRHMRTHTGERPYACHICQKRFSQKGNLSKHLKCHENAHLRWNRSTDLKPFKCPHPSCGRSFTAKLNLMSHIDTVHKNAAADTVQASQDSQSSCLHSGCTQTFHSQEELRSHLFSSTPGIVEEFNFLRQTALKFAEVVLNWDSYSSADKASMRLFAQSTLRAVASIPAATVPSDAVVGPAGDLSACRPTNSTTYGGTTNSEVSDTTGSGHKRSMCGSGTDRSGDAYLVEQHDVWAPHQLSEPPPAHSTALNHCSSYIHEDVCLPCYPDSPSVTGGSSRKARRRGGSVDTITDAGEQWGTLEAFLCDLEHSSEQLPPDLWATTLAAGVRTCPPPENSFALAAESLAAPPSQLSTRLAADPAVATHQQEAAPQLSSSLSSPEQEGGLFLPLLDAHGRITAGWRRHSAGGACCAASAVGSSVVGKPS